MWSEIERRLDVFVFRCFFAHSVWEARRMIIHGACKLNGRFVSLCTFFYYEYRCSRDYSITMPIRVSRPAI
jgi:hypothetical protein